MGKPVGARFITAGELNDTGRAKPWSGRAVFQAFGTTSAGAGTATVEIRGSIDGTTFVLLGTLTLSWTSPAIGTDGIAIDAPWTHIEADITAISGTDAAVDVWIGAQ